TVFRTRTSGLSGVRSTLASPKRAASSSPSATSGTATSSWRTRSRTAPGRRSWSGLSRTCLTTRSSWRWRTPRTPCAVSPKPCATRIPDVPVHYSRTPSVEAIAAGKSELIEALPVDGIALLNADDPRVRALAPRTKARVVLFGEAEDADLRATDVSAHGLEGLRFIA